MPRQQPQLHRALRLLQLVSAASLLALLPMGCNHEQPAAVGAPPPLGPSTPIHMVDRAQEAGLSYRFTIAGNKPYTILQTIGNGCGFLDYDQDGNLDILLVGSSGPKLYHGDGHGHFSDVTVAMGLTPDLPAIAGAAWLGCAVADIDNDGYPDIYLSGYRTGALFHNDHGKRFVDVTTSSGIHQEHWGTSCGFEDLDGDGGLDLFVCNYIQFSPDAKKYLQNCNMGVLTGCGPLSYKPEYPTLYSNSGDGHFADVSKASGMSSASGKALGVAFADYNSDGRPDITVANDLMTGDLFRNDGHLHFTNVGAKSGTALSADGRVHGGMGVDWADADGTGQLDAIVATFENEPKCLYHHLRGDVFSDETNQTGLGPLAFDWVSFGVKWLDLDNDGRPDILLANGHVYDNADKLKTGRGTGMYRQPLQVLQNTKAPNGSVKFRDITAAALGGTPPLLVGRGLATGDYDNDGRIDALVVDSEGAPLLLHNESTEPNHWIGFNLTGTGRSNRDAIGARATLTAGGHSWIKEVQTAGSYLSSSDKRLLFGLGNNPYVDKLTVRWPDGVLETWKNVRSGQYQNIVEGHSRDQVQN